MVYLCRHSSMVLNIDQPYSIQYERSFYELHVCFLISFQSELGIMPYFPTKRFIKAIVLNFCIAHKFLWEPD